MAYYGRRVTAGDTDYGTVSASNQRASVYNAMPENGWGHTFGVWGGKVSGGGAPGMRVAVWATDSSKNPSTLLGYTASITVNTAQTYGGDGQAYTGTVAAGTNVQSSGDDAIMLTAGSRYAIGVVATTYSFNHAMIAASRFAGDNENFYYKSGTTTPLNPNGYTSSSTEGWMSAWVQYQANRVPTCALSSPSDAATVTSATPTLTGTWTDADETYGDEFKRLRIQVADNSTGDVVWDTGVASATADEKTAKAFTRVVPDSLLSAGTTYKWRSRVSDKFDTWSDWTAYRTFTVNGGGTMTASTPTGKQEAVNGYTFAATWTHASSLSTNAVQLRILQGSTVVQTSGTITKTVAAGATSSVTFATAGFTALAWGITNYKWQTRGRDTGNVWSDWSNAVTFSTNNAPTTPTSLAPNSATQAYPARPLLQCKATDTDDTTATGLTVYARIKNSSKTVLQTRTMSYNTSSGFWEYQTVSGDLAAYGTFYWDAYSYDGTLYSGEQTSSSAATKSSEAQIIYAAGPTVAITAPTASQVLTTDAPTLTWTSSNTQQSYEVEIYRQSDGTKIYPAYSSGTTAQTGAATTSTTSHAMPTGYLRNGIAYNLYVTVVDTGVLTGSDGPRAFSLAYTAPTAVANFVASPEYVAYDSEPSAIRLTWTESDDANFTRYEIGRKLTGTTDDTELVIGQVTSISTISWIDYTPASGIDYEYSLRVISTQGSDETASDPNYSQCQVTFSNVIICHAMNGGTYRAQLVVDQDRGYDHIDDLVLERGWGESAPVALFGSLDYDVMNGTFRLVSDDAASATEYIASLRSLRSAKAPILYRDERGRRIFGVLSSLKERDRRLQTYEADIQVTEVAYDEELR